MSTENAKAQQPEQPTTKLEKHLSHLFQRDIDIAEGEVYKLKELHKGIHPLIKRCSELTSIPEDELVAIAARSAIHYKDIPWYVVIEVVTTFYLSKKQLEKEAK